MVMSFVSVRFPSGPVHVTTRITVSPLTNVTVHVITNSLPTIALSSDGVLIWTVAQAWGTAGWTETNTDTVGSIKFMLYCYIHDSLLCTVMFTVSSSTPSSYGLVTLQVYWVLWWLADTGSSTKVRDWLLELSIAAASTVIPSLIHSIVVAAKLAEHTIDTLSPTVSGIAMKLISTPGGSLVGLRSVTVEPFNGHLWINCRTLWLTRMYIRHINFTFNIQVSQNGNIGSSYDSWTLAYDCMVTWQRIQFA